MKKNVLLVLDSLEYKSKETEFLKILNEFCNATFEYTQYETVIIRFFHRVPFLGGLLTHISYWFLSFYYAVKLLSLKDKADSKIFINPIVGIFYAMLRRFLKNEEVICIAGFLFEPKKNRLYYWLRKQFVLFAYNRVSKIIIYSENELKYYQTIFPGIKEKFSYIKYGRDFHYKDKKEYTSNQPYIASGGRSNRDYQTLFSAMHLLVHSAPELFCIIATRPECIDINQIPSNTRIQYGIPLKQFGSFIANSNLFVLPLIDTKLSAGHMAMLEAMSVGIPVIVTDIPSIRDYVDENSVFFYKPGDAHDLATLIKFVYENQSDEKVKEKALKGKALYEMKYSFNALLFRIIIETLK